jgi:ABC-2 type transport system permease protein
VLSDAVLTIVDPAVSVAFAALGAFVGLRSGSGETVQGFFPLFFVLLFLSSMSLPRPLIEQDWFRTIATYNPVSYMVEGIRSLVISGWDGQALAQAFGIAAIAIVGFLALSARALRTRLVRT